MSAEGIERKQKPSHINLTISPSNDRALAFVQDSRSAWIETVYSASAEIITGGVKLPWGTVDEMTLCANSRAAELNIPVIRVNGDARIRLLTNNKVSRSLEA